MAIIHRNRINIQLITFVCIFFQLEFSQHYCLIHRVCLEQNQRVEMALTVWDVWVGGEKLSATVNRILNGMFTDFVFYFDAELTQIEKDYLKKHHKKTFDPRWRRIVNDMIEHYELLERTTFLRLMEVARERMGSAYSSKEEALMAAVSNKKNILSRKLSLNKHKKVYHDALLQALDSCRASVLGFRALVRAYGLKLEGRTADDVSFDTNIIPIRKDNEPYSEDEKDQLNNAIETMIRSILHQYFLHEMEMRDLVQIRDLYKIGRLGHRLTDFVQNNRRMDTKVKHYSLDYLWHEYLWYEEPIVEYREIQKKPLKVDVPAEQVPAPERKSVATDVRLEHDQLIPESRPEEYTAPVDQSE